LWLSFNNLTKLPLNILNLNKLTHLIIDKSSTSDPVVLQLLLEGKVQVELV
jgi:hypothetical protein